MSPNNGPNDPKRPNLQISSVHPFPSSSLIPPPEWSRDKVEIIGLIHSADEIVISPHFLVNFLLVEPSQKKSADLWNNKKVSWFVEQQNSQQLYKHYI